MYRLWTLPRPVTLFHTPLPSLTTTAFSVCRKPAKSGAADGLCVLTAVRYWSSVVFKHVRSQVSVAPNAFTPTRNAKRTIDRWDMRMLLFLVSLVLLVFRSLFL